MKVRLHIPLPSRHWKEIPPGGRQAVSACFMLMCGIVVIAATKNYIPKQTDAAATVGTVPVQTSVLKPGASESSVSVPASARADAAEIGEDDLRSSVRLNMAFLYPDGADSADVWNSYAGQACELLSELDAKWMSDMYAAFQTSPEWMAKQLGISRNAILGLYDSSDSAHDSDNPDSWVISSWKKRHITFYDGDRKVVSGYSNVKEIVSMASVYMYRRGMEDGDAFIDYCRYLWDISHQYSIHMGSVYYCDGSCQNAEDADGENVSSGTGEQNTAKTQVSDQPSETAVPTTAVAAPETNSAITITIPDAADAGPAFETSKDAAADGNQNVPETAPLNPEETASETQPETFSADQAASTAGNTISTENSDEASQEESSVVDNTDIKSRYALEDVPADWQSITGPARDMWEEVVAAYGGDTGRGKDAASAGAAANEEDEILCPGHIDLEIQAVILGTAETKDLFRADKKSTDWDGWTLLNKNHVHCVQKQDWESAYQLPVAATLYTGNPLSSAEITSYMKLLPDTATPEQRSIIMQALESVGCIPYYWGGKPFCPGFIGNEFGVVTTEDENGRNLRGLDCSGWINWVYWTALGTRLEFESTSGLTQCGRAVSRADLQPGDIIVRTGDDSHVYLFLAWTSDGEMYVIHETGGVTNNVTVSKVNVNWPYYRRLLPE